ncbi:Putative multidrug export ATP-binding/permease protein SAV1866 [Legionella pneumophila]|uniref:ABC transporter ATP-binding protein n=1 Tax=Legionella pneumophila TaxID=446 RepID=UPI000770A52C|nr:ABC transporter ATP-binding protein [Legionella pneumophila]CZG38587.1 Putative multidrug export ATP-binding/permease protein SAV1866 [Legionella pneumophila]CZH39936.1 Putative multidrug export ATP-binding/permease protein SAV1866 [Legionella pneumophila]
MKFNQFWRQIIIPYRYYIFLMMLTGLFWGIYISISPYLLKVVIDTLADSKPIQHVYLPAIGYVVLYFITALNFRALDWIKYKILPPIKKDIAMKMFNYIKLHSHDFFQNHFAGSMSNKVNDMVVSLESLLNSADEFFANFASFFIAIIVMYTVNPLFSIALLCWCVIFFVISAYFSSTIHKLSKNTSEAYSIYSGTLVDIIANISSVRLFSRFSYETNRLGNVIDDLVLKDRRMLKYIIKMRLVQDSTLVGLLGLMFYLLLYFYSKQMVTIGDFALILMITMSIFQAMWFLANRIVDVYKNIGKCFQAMSLIEIKHGVRDKQNAKELIVKKGSIEFNNVAFAYKNSTPIFNNLNIKIDPGSKIGLVGYSGSGKSTFINLILRLYDIQAGHILIDDQNISHVSQHSLRHNISMIPQDISLFHRSLIDNIRYGNVDASQEEVIQASKQAHCHEFISQLGNGYDTLVGERGIKLSGGQRQRIAIARAFLENAPILILDEATSSLDSVTEKYIQDSLHVAIQNRTTIVIAHRLSTLLEMDRILVFKGGHIIEDGEHKALIKANGHYAKMWAMQSNGFLPSDEGE